VSIYRRFAIVVSIFTIFSGCGGGGGNNKSSATNNPVEEGQNKLPNVYAGSDGKVQVDKPVTIYGKANDPDGVISEYEWTKDGEVLSTTLDVTYIPTELGVDTLTLTVIDNDGASASDSINLEVVEESIGETVIDNGDPLPF